MAYDKENLHDIIAALKAVSKTYKAETFIVGGAVRDILSLHQPKDIDVVTTGDIKQIADVLAKSFTGSFAKQIRAPFDLWRVSLGSINIDVVKMNGTIDEDYKKRNFSINAIYYNIMNAEYVDPSGNGMKDMDAHIIRAVSDDCFKKRSDNIFIAMRLVAELNFKVEPKTLKLMVDAVNTMGTDMEITKRGQKEIQRAKSGMFYQKAQVVSRYVGLGEFYTIYSPPKTASIGDIKILIAKYKSKKKTDKGNVIYEYGDKDKARRAEKKARHVRTVFKNIKKLVSTFEKDLSSEDMATKMCALAVGLIYHTYERVGDRSNIGTGITSLKKKHVTVSGNTVKLSYVGKSHVKQKKEVHDAKIAKIVRDLIKNKADNGYIFDYEGDQRVDIGAKDVNAYLRQFGITAKDLRGHAANDLTIDRLKKAPKPPKGASDAEKKKFYKEKLKEVIEDVAEEIGHTPGICKSSYIDPKLIDTYEESGKVAKIAAMQLTLFKGAINMDDRIMSHILSENPTISEDSIGNEVTALKSKIDSSDADVDADISNVSEVMRAIDTLKAFNPEALRGILKIRPSSKAKVPVPDTAYGFVVSDEPFIVYLNTDKIKNDVIAGKDVSSDLSRDIRHQIAGVIGHEGEHAKGEEGEAEPTRKQREIVKRLTESSDGSKVKTADTDENVFSIMGINVSVENAIPAAKEVIGRLKLGDGDRAVINVALLALGYLIGAGENPYRAEWNIRKTLNIDGSISFTAAKELYNILSRNAAPQKDPETSYNENMSLYADPTDSDANLGDSVSPKWEAQPSTWPEEWQAFLPQKHPVNY